VVYSQAIDAQLGHVLTEDPYDVIAGGDTWFQLGDSSVLGNHATYRYRFVSVDVP
jgi:hypothetical protein